MTDAAPDYHIPVLLQATVDGLNVRPDGCYVDCTFGGGGHSREILRRLGPNGRLLAFDQDADAQRNIPAGEDRLTFVQSNFRYLPNWLHYYGYAQVDGILADLGVSSHHFDAADRGFSFRFEGALDMRMNKRAHTSAAGVVNTYSEEQLANLFYLYGELNNGAAWPQPSSRPAPPRRLSAWSNWSTSLRPISAQPARRKIWPRCFKPCASR